MATHRTVPDDRIDKIAVRIYGNVDDDVIAQIIYRNPQLAVAHTLDHDIEFTLPDTLDELLALP